ncbi:uncharacterized protein LOC124164003 [Ischnura elegans]|uniref:uncharacterized protein LOC124164003 n=1 Tax=Ischnura elegans TaxID=197161 RepID=UPI001ED8827B|nr:uncharacterized protein LOC124164003 [Ischnura elegans]
MASRSGRFPTGILTSKRLDVVFAMALNTSALKTQADLLKQIPLNVIESYLTLPPRNSNNILKWEQEGERKLAIPFRTNGEMRDIVKKLHSSDLTYRPYYLDGKGSRLSMVSIFGVLEDIESVIGLCRSKWDFKSDSTSDSSDEEDYGTDSDNEDEKMDSDAYDMTFVVNLSLGLSYIRLAEEVATVALGLYRTTNDEGVDLDKHYAKWAVRGKIHNAYAAHNGNCIRVLCKESLVHDVKAYKTIVAQNGRKTASIIGLFGRKIELIPLLRNMAKL